MRTKNIGWLILAAGVILLFVTVAAYLKFDEARNQANLVSCVQACITQTPVCQPADSCPFLKKETPWYFFAQGALSIFLIGVGIYLVLLEDSQQTIMKSQSELAKALKEEKKGRATDEKFELLLSALDEAEKKVIQELRGRSDGIGQNTLRIRTDLSNSKLSQVISSLDRKGLVTKVKKGRINVIFPKKDF